MRAGMGFGPAAAVAATLAMAATTALAPGAAAQVAGAADARPLVLLCSGTDGVPIATNAYSYYYGGGGVYLQRIPAQLGVMVDKGQVRVRPPPSSAPLFGKADADGWVSLERPEVTEFLIRARTARIARILSDKLDVDRRTGAATFANFTGACRPVPNATAPAF